MLYTRYTIDEAHVGHELCYFGGVPLGRVIGPSRAYHYHHPIKHSHVRMGVLQARGMENLHSMPCGAVKRMGPRYLYRTRVRASSRICASMSVGGASSTAPVERQGYQHHSNTPTHSPGVITFRVRPTHRWRSGTIQRTQETDFRSPTTDHG